MPVSVVVGGQFGSEGKGKVALDIARRWDASAVVRVGGTNSGHTAIADDGTVFALRQLPAAALAQNALVILPPGSIINVEIFRREIAWLGLTPERVKVDPMATVIAARDILAEESAGITLSIGSTGSGTGAALQRRMSRAGDGLGVQASDHSELRPYLTDTTPLMRLLLNAGKRIVIEGTQGFGLSLLHGGYYPKATSRDTTAATFVGESGLGPLDVDHVAMVIRSFPIRVGGDSGPLSRETTWKEVAKQADLPSDFCEFTTATKKVRRVGKFDPEIVRRAIAANSPNEIILNHLDYVDSGVQTGILTDRARDFVSEIQEGIGRQISQLGTGPATFIPNASVGAREAA